jgi:hypothetical protein
MGGRLDALLTAPSQEVQNADGVTRNALPPTTGRGLPQPSQRGGDRPWVVVAEGAAP